MPKAPMGIREEDGPEFVEAVNAAASKGLVVWSVREQWNGTWACALADPNSNAPSMGDSIGYVRQGPTPGRAIYAAMERFAATDDEKAGIAMEKEFNQGQMLQALVRVSPAIAKDLLRALAANLDARRL